MLTLTYLRPLDVIDETRPAHLEWLAGEVDAGRILLAGRVEVGGTALHRLSDEQPWAARDTASKSASLAGKQRHRGDETAAERSV